MKFLQWCIGAMVVCIGSQEAWTIARPMRWVWVVIAVYWFFVGLGLAAMSLAKLATGKWRMGAARPPLAGKAHAPTDSKEE